MDLPPERLATILVEQLESPPLATERWSEDASTVEIILVTPRLSLVSSRGPGHPRSKTFYTAHGPRVCEREDSVVFWDLGALTSTDLGVVSTCIGIAKANRRNLAEVHMFYDSPLVGMAVTVVNVALGGLIRFHREAEPFATSFTRAATAAQRDAPAHA